MSTKNTQTEEPNVIKSKGKPYEIPQITFSEYLARKLLENDPNQIALISPKEEIQLTFAQLHRKIQEVANALVHHGVKKTDLVMFFGDNSFQYAVSMLAITYLGVTFTPLAPAHGPFELIQQLKDSRASVIIIDQNKISVLMKAINKPDFEDIASNVKLIMLMNAHRTPENLYDHIRKSDKIVTYEQICQLGLNDLVDQVPIYPTTQEDHYVILYTSGTTGLPKGAIHTQRTWLASVIVEKEDEKPGSRELLFLPIGHMSGTMILCRILVSGMTCILCTDNSLEDIFCNIEKFSVNYLLFTPAQALLMANGNYEQKYDTSSLKLMQYGGSKVPTNIVEIIKQKFKVTLVEIYGATECFGAIQIQNYGQPECLPGNVGTLVSNYEMKIVDIATGRNLGVFQHGEICVRGPMCFVGYLNNEQATKATIDENGWYHSGDIGYYDQYGALYIVDRIKEMIKYKSWSVVPAEIEDFIHRNPNIESVCVVGVKHNTDGQLPRAYIKLKPGIQPGELIERELHKSINENLGSYKRLRGGIRFIDYMPRTLIGKVDRKYFKELVQQEIIQEPVL